MEIKDLVLLMLMPIMMVSLIAYVDTNPVATGAATREQNDRNIIGTYSIMPSFKAKIDYDLGDYTKIKESLQSVMECTSQGKTIEKCVDDIQDNGFKWEIGCDSVEEKIIYDLVEFYQGCFDSEDTDCLCKKNMFSSKEQIEKYGFSNNKYELALTQDLQSKKIDVNMVYPRTDISSTVRLNDRSLWYPVRYLVAYSQEESVQIDMIFRDEIDPAIEYKEAFSQNKDLTLYKNKVNGINYVDFVKLEGDDIIYPNQKKFKPGNLNECKIEPKNIFKFCVTKKNYKILAYDKSDSKVRERSLTIRFAAYIPVLPPPALTNVEIADRPKSEKSVLAKWEKSTNPDTAKYKIYYADSTLNAFDKSSLIDLNRNPDVHVKEIVLGNTQTIELKNGLILNGCEFDYKTKKCMFSTAGNEISQIEDNKLYYSTIPESYVYSLNLPEDEKNYDFAVTVVDKRNNEIDNVERDQKFKIIRLVKSIEDLPPDSGETEIVLQGIKPIYEMSSKHFTFNFVKVPKKNLDGSDLKDYNGLKVYYKKFDKAPSMEEKRSIINNILDSPLKDLKSADIIDQKELYLKVSLASEDLQPFNIIYFVVIASDKSNNPAPEQFKIKELGAYVIENVIP